MLKGGNLVRTSELAKQLEDIREHVQVINDEVGNLTVKMAAISTDLRWIKYFVALSMFIALASLGVKIMTGF